MRKVQWFLLVLLVLGIAACASDPVPPPFPGYVDGDAATPDDVDAPVQPGCISDRVKRIFHREDCPLLKQVPLRDQERFENPYQALNKGYAPCTTCEPMAGRR